MKIILIMSVIAVVLSACGNSENPRSERNISNSMQRSIHSVPINDKTEITLGEAVTNILDTGKNRVSNILLACESISGTTLETGQEFSFNKIVGARSKSAGYKDAPIIFHGEKSYGVGGGVCQVSSTLYMAAKNAGLEIIERHSHSETIAYAPGTDATVVFGEKDMRFRNSADDTLYIYTWIQDNKVYAKIVKMVMS